MQRAEYVSGVADQPVILRGEGPAARPWEPRLIVPEHDNVSYEWLIQSRQMLEQRQWRVRHVDYENAPFGREVENASPYRWWLGALAGVERGPSDRPAGAVLEHVALYADPLMHWLLLAVVLGFAAWRLGWLAAVVISLGLALQYPFAATFLAGAPNDQSLVQILVVWSLLPLVSGTRALGSGADKGGGGRCFFVAGAMGGLGLWIGPGTQAPVLVGIGLGGVLAALLVRYAGAGKTMPRLPWLAWGLGGALAGFAGYLIEYFPSWPGAWQLRINHPVYAVTWLGGALLLDQLTGWAHGEPARLVRRLAFVIPAVAAFAALPVALKLTHSLGFLESNPVQFQLTRLAGGPAGTSIWNWLVHEGMSGRAWATLLPVLVLIPAVWLLVRQQTPAATRLAVVVFLGPALVAVGYACWQLRWWSQADAALCALAAVLAASDSVGGRGVRWIAGGLAALAAVAGAIQLAPSLRPVAQTALDETDVVSLVERDLARWMATHVGDPRGVILAPHNTAISLYYYGGLRGLPTLNRDNLDGLGAAIRVVSASTPEEAKELIDRRGITHLIIPSWDPYLETYTQMGMGKVEGTFYERLLYFRLPAWLQPVPYQLPTIPGFEGNSVTILEVVEDQEDAAALSRIAEYFVEMGFLDRAAAEGQALRRFPADLGALTARAGVEFARQNRPDFDKIVESILRRLSGGADRAQPWDRRVSLAVVLARSEHPDQAKEQVRRCLSEIDEGKIRSLGTGALYRLQELAKAYGLTIADARLRQLALDLLPADLSARLRR